MCVHTYVSDVLLCLVLYSQSGATPDYQFVCGSQVSFTIYTYVYTILCVYAVYVYYVCVYIRMYMHMYVTMYVCM